jgi:hypothetical protein
MESGRGLRGSRFSTPQRNRLEGPSPPDTPGAILRKPRGFSHRDVGIFSFPILAPFNHIPVHVVQAPCVGLLFTNVEIPASVNSNSLNSIMEGELKAVRDSLFLPSQDNQRAVRNRHLKLHVYPQINHELLFDLANDPHELSNLAVDPAYRNGVRKMHVLMDQWRTSLGNPHPLSSQNQQLKYRVTTTTSVS